MLPRNQVSRCGFARLLLPILAAFVWLMIPVSMQAAISQQERDALIAFYNSTNGAQWDLGHTWLGPVGSECGWSGVTCDSAQNTVLQLNVTLAGGSIRIPPKLGDLTNLQVLSISGAGAFLLDDLLLPEEVGNLKNLQELTLSGFAAGRGIPAAIVNLTNLTKLHITSCRFGINFHFIHIPAEIGNLTKLQELVISWNYPLEGSIPTTLGNLTELTTLDLSHNQLSGAIPPALGNLTKLQRLDLNRNVAGTPGISGPIPAELGNLKELNFLDLSGNALSGAIPPALGNLTKLQYLNLFYNQLSGPILAELGNLKELNFLDLSRNQLSGAIPPALGNLTKLQQLNLSENQLSGPIPAELGNLTELITLNVSSNNLTGSIPPALGNLPKVQQLYLSNNQLSGPIPAELGNLTKLETLYLDGDLSGLIPAELGNLTKLQRLDLHANLNGPIPAELGNLTELTTLNLSGNTLVGSIPPALGNLTKLQRLDLSYNFLPGPIPAELGNLTELTYLDLSYNHIEGSIPPALGNPTKLQELYLSDNQLSGPIPAELGYLKELNILNLRSNLLSGAILVSLGNLTKLQQLNLSENQLSGAIPAELGNLKELNILNLSFNRLSGAIPPALGNMTKLGHLILTYNQLSGAIPPELASLKNLFLLYLQGNRLSGAIPVELGNMPNLTDLALSNNQLGGSIPSELGNLVNMSQLLLESNRLTGSIPPSLRDLTRMSSQNFNLSYNGLYAVGNSLKAFLDAHATWGNQTVAPGSVSAQPESSFSLLVQWASISFTAYGGRYEVWGSAASGGPYTLAGATPDKLASSLRIEGLSAAPTWYLVVRTVSDPNFLNQNTVTSDFSAKISIAMPVAAMDLTLSAGGAATAATIGSTGALETGYARVDMNSGNAFYGIAVYSYRPDGIVVSECGVSASPPTTAARIFVDYRTGATIPGSSGKVNIDTGLSLVNRGAGPALITFTLRNLNGQILSLGTGSLAQDAHVAKYLWELPAMVSGFSIPATFATETRYGTLEIVSDQPLSVVALRLTTNQRGEMLMTSTPVADLTRPLGTAPIYFAEFIDGGGYTTTLMLLNTSSVMMTGMLRIYANDGTALAVQQVGGAAGSAFAYAIVPGGAYVLQTDAAPVNFNVGWVELIPDQGTPTPMGAGVYQSSQDGVLAAESGIAAATPTTHARIFVDTAGGHNSSVALANPGTASASIAFAALGMDGTTAVGTSVGPMMLNGKGHAAQFVWERISGLPEGFRGVLDIVSATPFVPLTIRALVNERGNFLFTAFPVADMNQAAPSPILFPQIAAGGGTTTEIIMLSAGTAGGATLRYFGNTGTPLAIGK